MLIIFAFLFVPPGPSSWPLIIVACFLAIPSPNLSSLFDLIICLLFEFFFLGLRFNSMEATYFGGFGVGGWRAQIKQFWV